MLEGEEQNAWLKLKDEQIGQQPEHHMTWSVSSSRPTRLFNRNRLFNGSCETHRDIRDILFGGISANPITSNIG